MLIVNIVEEKDKEPQFNKSSLVRVPIRLGQDAFTVGEITEENISRMIDAMKAFKLLITGGGAFNKFLIKKINENLAMSNVEVIIAEDNIVLYKEALIMALLGVLRWREENTVLASVTGGLRNSIGGAVWIGQEA